MRARIQFQIRFSVFKFVDEFVHRLFLALVRRLALIRFFEGMNNSTFESMLVLARYAIREFAISQKRDSS
jgi:hypothetical protein